MILNLLTLFERLGLEPSCFHLERLLGRHVAAGAFIGVLIAVRLVAVTMPAIPQTGPLRVLKGGTAASRTMRKQ